MIDRNHLGHGGGGQLAGRSRHPLPRDRDLHRHRAAGQLLRRRDGFPAGAIELAVFLFGDDENHRTLASSRSRLTSSFAASPGEPPIITVCLAFCGAYSAVIFCRAAPAAAGATLAISFFFAAMMPLSVA